MTLEPLVPLRSLRPLESCLINGYRCEVVRQARRSTFLRVVDNRLPGRTVVQLEKKTPKGDMFMVRRWQ